MTMNRLVPGQPTGSPLMSMLQAQQSQQANLQRLVQELTNQDENSLKAVLSEATPERRWAAIQVIANRKLPLQDELIEKLTDPRRPPGGTRRPHPTQCRTSQRSAKVQIAEATPYRLRAISAGE
jgi:hypothetical protein